MKKRLVSLLLVMVMVVCGITGCKGAAKQTMFSIMKESAEMEKYSFEIKANVKSDTSGLDDFSFTLSGKADGENYQVGLRGTYAYFSFDFTNLVTITPKAVYVDVEQVIAMANTLGLAFDIEEMMGADIKVIELPLVEGLVDVKSGKEAAAFVTDMMEKVFADTKIESSKGTFSLEINSYEDMAKIVKNMYNEILNNKDKLIELSTPQVDISTETVKKVIYMYLDAAVNGAEKFNNDYNLFTADEFGQLKSMVYDAIDEGIDEVLEEMDLENASDASDMYKEMFDELANEKDEVFEELDSADAENVDLSVKFSNSLTGKAGKRVYTADANVDLDDKQSHVGITMTINSKITEDKNLTVSAPANYTSLEDLVYAGLVLANKLGYLDSFTNMY